MSREVLLDLEDGGALFVILTVHGARADVQHIAAAGTFERPHVIDATQIGPRVRYWRDGKLFEHLCCVMDGGRLHVGVARPVLIKRSATPFRAG